MLPSQTRPTRWRRGHGLGICVAVADSTNSSETWSWLRDLCCRRRLICVAVADSPRRTRDPVTNWLHEHHRMYICTRTFAGHPPLASLFAASRSNYFASGPTVTVRCIASWEQGTGTDRWAIRIGSFHARQPRETAKHPRSRS